MKIASVLYLLTLGIWGVLALPSSSTALEPRCGGEACCPGISCFPEYQLTYEHKTRTCGCSPKPELATRQDTTAAELSCYRRKIACPTGTHIYYNPVDEICSCVKDCALVKCAAGFHSEIDLRTGCSHCVKELTTRQDTTAAALSCSRIKIKCPTGTHIYYNPVDDICSCVKDCPLIKCAPGFHSEIEPKTGCPYCVKGCPFAVRCAAGYHPETDPKTGCQKCVKDVVCPLIACVSGYHAVYDPVTKCATGCVPDCPIPICLEGYHEVINPETTCTECEKDVDPTTCPLIRCASGTHPFYNPEKKECFCNPDDGKTICFAATECSPGSSPSWNTTTETCSCTKNAKRAEAAVVDPATWPVCPNTIFCAAGAHKAVNKGSTKCVCKLDNPIPATCPQFKCLEKNHVVYNAVTKKCGCVPDCPDIFCIAEKTPVYQPATNTCACQWIPGLEPVPVVLPKPTNPCNDVFCISEQHSVFNSTSQICECEWIDGFGPTPIKQREASVSCPSVKCISEKHGVYNATTHTCECVWIDGFGPVSS